MTRSIRLNVFLILFVVLAVLINSGCGTPHAAGGGVAESPGETLTFVTRIRQVMARITQNGTTVSVDGTRFADLAQVAPVTTTYGTVTQGTTLNELNIDGLPMLVYGNDGVFAAECEASPLDATYGPSHPNCQTIGAENYDRVILCFANTENTPVMVAQTWAGPAVAFDDGRGMICYVDGVMMRSTHVFTY